MGSILREGVTTKLCTTDAPLSKHGLNYELILNEGEDGGPACIGIFYDLKHAKLFMKAVEGY